MLRRAFALALLAFPGPATAAAQRCAGSTGFIRLVDGDTAVLEIARVSAGSAYGEMLLLPERLLVRYSADTRFAPDSSRLTVEMWQPGRRRSEPPDQKGELVIRADSSIYVAQKGTMKATQRLASHSGAFPMYPLALGLEQLLLLDVQVAGGLLTTRPMHVMATGGWEPAARIQMLSGRAVVDVGGTRSSYDLDGKGAITAATYADSSGKTSALVRRVSCEALAKKM